MKIRLISFVVLVGISASCARAAEDDEVTVGGALREAIGETLSHIREGRIATAQLSSTILNARVEFHKKYKAGAPLDQAYAPLAEALREKDQNYLLYYYLFDGKVEVAEAANGKIDEGIRWEARDEFAAWARMYVLHVKRAGIMFTPKVHADALRESAAYYEAYRKARDLGELRYWESIHRNPRDLPPDQYLLHLLGADNRHGPSEYEILVPLFGEALLRSLSAAIQKEPVNDAGELSQKNGLSIISRSTLGDRTGPIPAEVWAIDTRLTPHHALTALLAKRDAKSFLCGLFVLAKGNSWAVAKHEADALYSRSLHHEAYIARVVTGFYEQAREERFLRTDYLRQILAVAAENHKNFLLESIGDHFNWSRAKSFKQVYLPLLEKYGEANVVRAADEVVSLPIADGKLLDPAAGGFSSHHPYLCVLDALQKAHGDGKAEISLPASGEG